MTDVEKLKILLQAELDKSSIVWIDRRLIISHYLENALKQLERANNKAPPPEPVKQADFETNFNWSKDPNKKG